MMPIYRALDGLPAARVLVVGDLMLDVAARGEAPVPVVRQTACAMAPGGAANNVFMKGGDYTREALPEADMVDELGGRALELAGGGR
jgi:bifunctional ADP-heptose synthase (sugar kinase/adenylyltransferase)